MAVFNFSDVFQQTVDREFRFLKQDAPYWQTAAKSIALASGGALVPIHQGQRDDADLIKILARWREDNAYAYCDQFPITVEGTKKWLGDLVLDNPGRMLFLIVDAQGHWIGHAGLANCLNDDQRIELDAILRGDPARARGIMAEAVTALAEWARHSFLPEEIYLRVLEDNTHAVEFYQRLGFVTQTKIPLIRHETETGCRYTEAESGQDADRFYLRMVLEPGKIACPDEMILTAGPQISARELAYTGDAVRYGWNRQWSDYLIRFERAFADYIGVKYALATSCGTGALHIALKALGIGPGDEVIVPDLTWVATGQAVNYVGAIPVFADVQRDGWCLDPASFEAVITPRTRAVMPVHLYGHPAKMDEIMAIARRHKIAVVEDAAPSIGAEVVGQRTGSFGEFAMFSFQGAKLTVTGEGGMLVTNDDALYARARKIWDQGRRPGTFWIDEVGLKYKMSNVQAALGLGQLEHVDQLIAAKRKIFSWYEQGLAGCDQIELMREADWAHSIYWMTNILVKPGAPLDRDGLIAKLREHNVDSRPVFPSMSLFEFWPRQQAPQPNARMIGEQGINLPSGVCLTQAQVLYVCDCLKKVLS